MTDNFDDIFGSDEFDGFDDLSGFDDLGDLGDMPDFSGADVPDLTGDAPDLRGELGMSELGMGDTTGDLDDLPDFSGMGTTDLGLTEDPDLEQVLQQQGGTGGSRLGRPFMIAMISIVVAIICIAAGAVVYALIQDDGLSEAEELNTSVPLTNTALYVAWKETEESLIMMETATQRYLATAEAEVTEIYIRQLTQEANMTQTAIASATAAAQASATQAELNAQATIAAQADAAATAEANTLRGVLTTTDGVPIANATIRVYKDDGSGNPPGGGGPVGDSGGSSGSGGGGASSSPVVGDTQPITYLGQETGTVTEGQADAWVFNGTANDVVLINAIAADATQTDLYLKLVDAAGTVLIEDDNSGSDSNAAILNFTLPTTGEYIIQVLTVSGGGDYTLSLSRGLTIPATSTPAPPTQEPAATGEEPAATAEEPAATVDPFGEPTQETGDDTNAMHIAPNQGIVLVSNSGPSGRAPLRQDDDGPVGECSTDGAGNFDCGELPPGIYWLEVPYDQLPPDQQALVSPGTSMWARVEVPSMNATFRLMPPGDQPTPPTATPTQVDPFFLTATAFAVQLTQTAMASISPDGTIDIFTATPSPEPGADGTLPTALPDGGFFDDIGSDGGISGASGLTVMAIAAAGMVAVVFIARRLRNAG